MTQLLKLMMTATLSLGLAAPVFAENCTERPPYSGKYQSPFAEYAALGHWGAGAAFRSFAPKAGFDFNFEAYMADCPNLPLFGYGLHEGRGCTEGFDVTNTYVSYFVVLNNAYHRDPAGFSEYFLKHAQKMDFEKYLIPVQTP